jgi:DNA-binding MarR family transcriptional regulator
VPTTRNKLTATQVAEVRWLYAMPEHKTQRELARLYNVNPSQISRAVRGVAWPDADGPVFPHRPAS